MVLKKHWERSWDKYNDCIIFFYSYELHANPKIFFIVTLLRFANVPKTFQSFLVASQKSFNGRSLSSSSFSFSRSFTYRALAVRGCFLSRMPFPLLKWCFGKILFVWMIFCHMLLHIETPQRLLAMRTWHRIVCKSKFFTPDFLKKSISDAFYRLLSLLGPFELQVIY